LFCISAPLQSLSGQLGKIVMKKAIFTSLGCAALAAFCLLFTCGGFGWRYMSSGVNPMREIRMATWGETIEIKSDPEHDGRTHRRLIIDGIDHARSTRAKRRSRRNSPRRPPFGHAFRRRTIIRTARSA
jgi:hypothetical protein